MKIWVVFEGYTDSSNYVDGYYLGIVTDDEIDEYKKANPSYIYFKEELKE